MSLTCILTAEQMRWADEATISEGIDAFNLMDRAGFAVACSVLEQMPDFGRVVIVVGGGNNGGDGFAAAHHLRNQRIPVTVVSLVPLDSLNTVASEHALKARECGTKIREACEGDVVNELDRWLARAAVVVDAIFGIGLTRPLTSAVVEVVEHINRCDRMVISIDIASGLNANTGEVMGAAIRADRTVPIAASKWGHWLADGRDYTGKLLPIAEIGISSENIRASWQNACDCEEEENCFCVNSTALINEAYLIDAWPSRRRLTHKGHFGHVWVFGGSLGYTGAPQLAGLGAYAAGAGLASIACPESVWPVVASANLEVMVHPEASAPWSGEADAVVAGPGWGGDRDDLMLELMASGKSMVIDADGLNTIAGNPKLQKALAERNHALTVITPHPGEAARLLERTVEQVQHDRKLLVLELAEQFNCWVVLKGSETLIASPARDVYLNPFGSPQLAIAGSGDVLAGMIGARLAWQVRNGGDIGQLISSAVALHGKAGSKRDWYLAGDLAHTVSDVRHVIEQDRRIQ